MFIDLLSLTFIIVFIVDYSGVVDSIKSALSRFIARPVRRLRPLDCSLCMTFWSCLVYIIIEGRFNLQSIAIVCAFAALATIIHSVLRLAIDIIATLIQLISKILQL